MKKFIAELKKLAIALMVGVMIFVVLFLMFVPTYDQSKYYKNKAEFEKAKTGWIPSILPNSAYDIREKHNSDTNYCIGSFRYLPEDEDRFMDYLEKKDEVFTWKRFIFAVQKDKKIAYFSCWVYEDRRPVDTFISSCKQDKFCKNSEIFQTVVKTQ